MKIFFTCFSIMSVLSAGAQSVSLDNTFGNSGITLTPNTSEIIATTLAPDGSIFSAGYTIQPGGSGIYHLTVSKHNSNGTISNTFGTNGVVQTSVNYSEMPYSITLQPDGKILVAGSAYLGPTPTGPGDYRSFCVRYLPDGTLDQSFATNGIFEFYYSDSHLTSILLQNNGSMLLVGNANYQSCIVKLTSSGAMDTSYGSGTGIKFIGDANYTLINWGGITLSDGTTLVYGYEASDWENSKISCAKLDAQGNFVPTFGQGGKALFDTFSGGSLIDPVVELASEAVELPDGSILLNGQALDKMILKVLPTGTLDAAFATNGIYHHNFPSKEMLVQPDGKILLGGSAEVNTYNYGFTITRLNTDCTLDNSFNGTGSFTADISPNNDYLQSMVITGPEKLVVGGSSYVSSGSEAIFMLAGIDTDAPLGLSTNDWEAVSAYPNPFTDELTLSAEGTALSGITLYDASGRVVREFPPVGSGKLSCENLADGMYQLVLTAKSGEYKRIQVMKH